MGRHDVWGEGLRQPGGGCTAPPTPHPHRAPSTLQYLVVDLNRFSPGEELAPGLLTVVEQIPGRVVWGDATTVLAGGYFPSFNVPYFREVSAGGSGGDGAGGSGAAAAGAYALSFNAPHFKKVGGAGGAGVYACAGGDTSWGCSFILREPRCSPGCLRGWHLRPAWHLHLVGSGCR